MNEIKMKTNRNYRQNIEQKNIKNFKYQNYVKDNGRDRYIENM